MPRQEMRKEMVVGTVMLGVSLAVPEPHGSRLQEWRRSYGDAAASGIPTHITLLPPTEAAAERASVIEDHLEAIAAAGHSFAVRIAGTGTFRPVSPVVYVQVVEGGAVCERLQERIRDPRGPLPRELQFPYHPHVTVAHGTSDEAMDQVQRELADYEASWIAEGFALYEQDATGEWSLMREFRFPRPDVPAPQRAAQQTV